MTKRLLPALLVLLPLALSPGAAGAATKTSYPSISKLSPLKLGIGDTMTVKGKNFRAGTGKNTVVFKRDGGRSIFVRAGKATRTTLSVKIPTKLLPALAQRSGRPVSTRFRIRVLAQRAGQRFTTATKSPMIGPRAITTPTATKDDCDGDLIANAADTDDDNDLLSDALEATLKTNACAKDSDGDGMTDGWEHESALDYNGRAVPAPLRRPYPNALDAKDGTVDSDGDGLTNVLEYVAWTTFSSKLPLSYSGGDPATGGKAKPAPGREYADRDGNGFLSDNERDADGDNIPNQDEGGVGPLPVIPNLVGFFSEEYIALGPVRNIIDFVPLYGPLDYVNKIQGLSWVDPDSDGDTVADDRDDQDGDTFTNLDEMLTELSSTEKEHRMINPCSPSIDARLCIVGDDDIDNDGLSNRVDDDKDGDLLGNKTETDLRLNPFKPDTDGDGVTDGFEYYSALDLNSSALPFPGKRNYPNALDPTDAGLDHDGDSLGLLDEQRAWLHTIELGGPSFPLSYSDGNQRTGGERDDNKDVDSDGVSNFTELNGPLSGQSWWTRYVADNKCGDEYVESVYPGPKYQGLDFVDPDSDGDGVNDGADDIDHDGLSNEFESRPRDVFGQPRVASWCADYISVAPPAGKDGTDAYARVDPFNPCKPVNSAACHVRPPLGYYKKTDTYVEDWRGAEPSVPPPS